MRAFGALQDAQFENWVHPERENDRRDHPRPTIRTTFTKPY
jgi:hypothetical protein